MDEVWLSDGTISRPWLRPQSDSERAEVLATPSFAVEGELVVMTRRNDDEPLFYAGLVPSELTLFVRTLNEDRWDPAGPQAEVELQVQGLLLLEDERDQLQGLLMDESLDLPAFVIEWLLRRHQRLQGQLLGIELALNAAGREAYAYADAYRARLEAELALAAGWAASAHPHPIGAAPERVDGPSAETASGVALDHPA